MAAVLDLDRGTPRDLRAIRRALDLRAAGHATIEEHVDADMHFHRAVVAAARNGVLLDLFDSFVPRLRQAMVEMLRIRTGFDEAADHDAHARLAEAVAARDPHASAGHSPAHLRSLKDALG